MFSPVYNKLKAKYTGPLVCLQCDGNCIHGNCVSAGSPTFSYTSAVTNPTTPSPQQSRVQIKAGTLS